MNYRSLLNRLRAYVALATSVCAHPVEMKPFPMDSKELSGGAADLAFLLDAPAGKRGFIQVKDGHLATPDGRRFRIWGTNVVAAGCTPSREGATILAAQLARFGINCLRFHFLDRPAPNGIIDPARNDTREFDAARLDRFDFFVAELKKRGIYVNLNLNVGRTYKEGDGVRDWELLGFAKGLTYFDERLLELQREYARKLLTHRNPYTGAEYRHEPAVLMIEMVNENSIVESWVNNRLLGKAARRNPGTWTDIPASYERALTAKFNDWLRRKLDSAELGQLRAAAGAAEGAPVPRLKPAEFAAAPALRFHTEAKFYMELEDAYFQSMRALIRDELGAKALLVGTRANTVYPLLASAARLDIVDGHTYWQHPRYIEDKSTGRRTGFEIGNTPMVNEPLRSSVIELSKAAVAGKPYTVSEVNHPFPNEYSSEGVPILTAWAALQDWDGIFWFSFGNSDPAQWRNHQAGHFELRPDPVKMTQIAAGALAFLRGDVRPAEKTVPRSYSAGQVRESLRLPRTERPYFTPGFPLSIPLRHATRVASLDGAPPGDFPAGTVNPIESDTKELLWDVTGDKMGVVTVNTARTQALVGFLRARARTLPNLAAAVTNDFCAVVLTSIDGQPLARSRKMLLAVGARVANTGMKWDQKRTSLLDWGGPPTLIEPVAGTITLRNLAGAAQVEAAPLSSAGNPMGAPIRAKKTAAGWEFAAGDPATTWYLITRR